MPGSTKSTASTQSSTDNTSIPFEEALKKLESIVESMESGDLPLEKMLSHYEEGMRLSQVCQSKLSDAELKIEQLEKNADGVLSAKPIHNSGTPEDE